MVIAENKAVFVHYTLTENTEEGEFIESTEGQDPLGFIYGVGMMIPAFEDNLQNLKTGDTFSFGLAAAEAYGELTESAIVDIPRSAFEQNGAIPEGVLEVGNVLPMRNEEGEVFNGVVAWVGLESVKVDFNHPMAGKNLWFKGHVELVREVDPSEHAHGHLHGPDGHHHH